MADSRLVTVTDARTQIIGTDARGRRVLFVRNESATVTIRVGDDTITATTNGPELPPRTGLVFDGTRDELFGIAPAGQSAVVGVLEMF